MKNKKAVISSGPELPEIPRSDEVPLDIKLIGQPRAPRENRDMYDSESELSLQQDKDTGTVAERGGGRESARARLCEGNGISDSNGRDKQMPRQCLSSFNVKKSNGVNQFNISELILVSINFL